MLTGDRAWVLVAAHFDGQGMDLASRPMPGADDNASGVAALVELAHRTKERQPAIDVRFAAFAGEELTRMGSRLFAEHFATGEEERTGALAPPLAVINLDMVGRVTKSVSAGAIGYRANGPDGADGVRAQELVQDLAAAALEVSIDGAALSLVDLNAQSSSPHPTLDTNGEGAFSDDESFRHLAPTVLLTTGLHDDRHQTSDTVTKIDYRRIEQTVELVLRLLERLASVSN